MASRKRRRHAKSSAKHASTPRAATLHRGDCVAGLPAPNLLVPLDSTEKHDKLGLYMRWPLSLLKRVDKEAGDKLLHVFVDNERHQTSYDYEWQDHPPTWMDPHLFLHWAYTDPEIKRLCQKAFDRNDADDTKSWKALVPELQRIFDEKYLPYIMARFETQAAGLLSQWLLRRWAYRKTAPTSPDKQGD